jgi:hypothetical protein
MRVRFRLFAKKQVYVPTVLGWSLLLGCMAVLSFVCVNRAYPFLAYENPNDSDVFIIEGWVPDYVLDRSLVPFKEGHCRLLIATGGPLEVGSELSQYKTYAGLTAARLVKMGFREEQIVAVPSEAVDRDRTYASALEVREWLAQNPGVHRANLVTQGAHTRRSFIIFKTVLPATFELGACAVPPRDYDPKRWWATSEGFRMVVSEGIAYTYARLAGPR